MLSLIQVVLAIALVGTGIGLKFGPGWLLVVGLLAAGLLPMLLVVNLFVGRR
jgi:hypothetical protein